MLNTSPNFRDTTPLPINIPNAITLEAPVPLVWGKWLALESVRYINPITGVLETREQAVRQKAAGVVDIFPIDVADRVAMILQFRAAHRAWVLESPAGLIDLPKPGEIEETPHDAALRELAEETGWRVKSEDLVFLSETPSSAGSTNETIQSFIARNCQYVEGLLDHQGGEIIQPVIVPFDQVGEVFADITARGVLIDPRLQLTYFRELSRRLSQALLAVNPLALA